MKRGRKLFESGGVLPIIAALFFLSGATGLIYEVVWTRLLVGVFGATVLAVSTVLAAFMAGLALGSYLFGRIADRSTRPLLVFSGLQIGVGLVSLAVPLLVRFAERAYPGLPAAFQDSFWLLSLARFGWCGLIILVPTTLMGATLPVLSKWITGRGQMVGKGVGALYSINTFGAVLGTLVGGLYLVPKIGLSASILLAAAVNILVGLLVLLTDRRARKSAGTMAVKSKSRREVVADGRRPPPPAAVPSEISTRLILWLFGVAGFCSLAYEVLWTRVLIVFVPSTTFAFATMLSTFLAGIALGSLICSRFVDRLRSPAMALGLVEAGIAATALASLTSFAHLGSIASAVTGEGADWGGTLAVEFILPALIMIVPALLMGAAFPIVARIRVTDHGRAGSGIGSIYAANTVGAILGAFVSGFVLIPTIGIQASVVLAACGNLGVALVALARTSASGRVRASLAGVAVAAAVVLALTAPIGQPVALSPGIETLMGSAYEVIFYDEGITASLTVTRSPELDIAGFFIDRWPAVGTSHDAMKTVKLLGHLPIAAADQARNVLVIGYGMGMTAWTIALHDEVESFDVVELSEGVVEASEFFRNVNHDVL
ncbi:MAG: fused MFS/spermidine synthase, partial [Candidatus Eisenbacteria sp.]|nr:fused MFS/spermidine synthase [Candidatus Eisenbacteria bacterium]